MWWGPLLIVVGCLFIALAVFLVRNEAPDRRRFWRAERVTGEVHSVTPGEPPTARIRYSYRGKEYEVFDSPGWDSESNQWGPSYALGDRVPLLIPRGSPDRAVTAHSVNHLYVGPAAFGLMGTAALGFGLLLLTGSLAIAGPLLAVMVVGGLGLFLYNFLTDGKRR